MEERCSRCKVRLFPSDRMVRCNDCGALYHLRCWTNYTEKCVVCGKDNDDFSDKKVQAYKKAVDEKVIQELSKEEKNDLEERVRQEAERQHQKANVQSTVKDNLHTTPVYRNVSTNNYLNSEETGMFSNVGKKLKSWAKTHFIISVVLGVIIFITTWAIDDDYILVGFFTGLTEIFVAWAFSLILYAFGELVQNSKESKDIQQKILNELKDKKE